MWQEECVEDWIGHWTQDQKLWALISTTGHMYKCQANFYFHTTSVHPAVTRTLWNKEDCTVVTGLIYRQYSEFSSEEMRL